MNEQTARVDIRIGDVYVVNFNSIGCVQRGVRPAVVFQNNKGNAHSPNVIVFPLTSKIKKLAQPTHVFLPAADSGLAVDSMVLCENPVCVPKELLSKYITSLPQEMLRSIAAASILASGGICFIGSDEIAKIQNTATELNATVA